MPKIKNVKKFWGKPKKGSKVVSQCNLTNYLLRKASKTLVSEGKGNIPAKTRKSASIAGIYGEASDMFFQGLIAQLALDEEEFDSFISCGTGFGNDLVVCCFLLPKTAKFIGYETHPLRFAVMDKQLSLPANINRVCFIFLLLCFILHIYVILHTLCRYSNTVPSLTFKQKN